uniref:Uncharacterized protein n=1 Tax=Davidia involucrata TaxID=16924 RepID=A0A5B7BLJ4_DAVIN
MRLIHSIVLAVFLVLLCVQPYKASRILNGEEWWTKKGDNIVLQSLQKGPVTPSDPSGCTNIPGGGGTSCPIKEMNFAGDALARGTAHPHLTVPFGVATNEK